MSSVALSANGSKLAIGSADTLVRVYHADGSGAPSLLKGHKFPIRAIAFSPDGSKLATGSDDELGRIYNVDGSGDPILLTGHKGAITAIAWSPDGKAILTGSEDKTARVWDPRDIDRSVVLRGHGAPVSAVAWSPDSKSVATLAKDVRLWTMDIDALAAALWSATTDCIPELRRRELLFESAGDAEEGHAHCRQTVARRSGWPAP